MRIDVFDTDKRVYSEGIDEYGVWEWPGGEPEPFNVYHEGKGALEHGIEFNLFPLANLQKRGHQVKLAGQEIIDNVKYFVLKIILRDGFETYRYVNSDTWLVDRARDFRAFHPGVDATKKDIETQYDAWQEVAGILFAGRSLNVELKTGEIIGVTDVLNTKYYFSDQQLDLDRSYVPNGAPAN